MEIQKSVSRWRKTHRWLAWSLGIVFILQGLSGAFLVVAEQIDAFLNPEMTMERGTDQAFFFALAKLEDAHPGAVGMGVAKIDKAGKFMTAFWPTPDPVVPSEYRYWLGRLHPLTGEVISAHDYGDFPANTLQLWAFVHALHTNLTMGAIGKFFQIGGAVFLLTLLISGVINVINRRRVLLHKPAHLIRDSIAARWHRRLGLGFVSFLAVLIISGVAWQLETVLDKSFTLQSKDSGERQMRLYQAWMVAQHIYPNSEPRLVMAPFYQGGTFRVKLIPQTGVLAGQEQELFLDAYSGKLIKVRNNDNLSGFEKTLSLIEPIHGGLILGSLGKWLAFFSGLVPLVMMVLGLLNRRFMRPLQKKISN